MPEYGIEPAPLTGIPTRNEYLKNHKVGPNSLYWFACRGCNEVVRVQTSVNIYISPSNFPSPSGDTFVPVACAVCDPIIETLGIDQEAEEHLPGPAWMRGKTKIRWESARSLKSWTLYQTCRTLGARLDDRIFLHRIVFPMQGIWDYLKGTDYRITGLTLVPQLDGSLNVKEQEPPAGFLPAAGTGVDEDSESFRIEERARKMRETGQAESIPCGSSQWIGLPWNTQVEAVEYDLEDNIQRSEQPRSDDSVSLASRRSPSATGSTPPNMRARTPSNHQNTERDTQVDKKPSSPLSSRQGGDEGVPTFSQSGYVADQGSYKTQPTQPLPATPEPSQETVDPSLRNSNVTWSCPSPPASSPPRNLYESPALVPVQPPAETKTPNIQHDDEKTQIWHTASQSPEPATGTLQRSRSSSTSSSNHDNDIKPSVFRRGGKLVSTCFGHPYPKRRKYE